MWLTTLDYRGPLQLVYQLSCHRTKVPVSLRMKHFSLAIETMLKGPVSMHYSWNRAFQQCFNSVSSLRKLVLSSCVLNDTLIGWTHPWATNIVNLGPIVLNNTYIHIHTLYIQYDYTQLTRWVVLAVHLGWEREWEDVSEMLYLRTSGVLGFFVQTVPYK